MNYPRIPLFSALLWVLLAVSCDLLNNDLKSFLEEQTGGITLRQPASVPGDLVIGTDGYVCLEAGCDEFPFPWTTPWAMP
jgi:hypothetical protein